MDGLVFKDVSKHFGDRLAVDKISFTLKEPSVFGLLGTNGAGKTTTIRMLLGIITKDHGEITWNGKPVSRETVNFGYLPEERGVYPKVKVYDQIMYFAELRGIDKARAAETITKWSKELKITEYLDLPAEKLSKGNQQKVQFLAAIVHDPDLVVLDEPFSGLDPVNTDLLKNIIIKLTRAGKYIIMSAHQMPTIEEFCTDILILNRGKTVLQGNLKSIKSTYPVNRLQLEADQDLRKYLKDFEIENETNHRYTLRISDESSAHKLLRTLVENQVLVTKFELMRPTLNDIFIEKVGAKK